MDMHTHIHIDIAHLHNTSSTSHNTTCLPVSCPAQGLCTSPVLGSLACQPCVCAPISQCARGCRTVGPWGPTVGLLSDCRTVGLSEGMLDSLTGLDSLHTSNNVGPLSDHCQTLSCCRTVGLSDCRRLSECCRTTVGACCQTVGPGLCERAIV